MKDLKVDIDRMYDEILDLKESYEKVKTGLPVPLRAMAWNVSPSLIIDGFFYFLSYVHSLSYQKISSLSLTIDNRS